jgi:hypothetical protein
MSKKEPLFQSHFGFFRPFLMVALSLPLFIRQASAQQPQNIFDFQYTYSSPSDSDFNNEITLHEGKVELVVPLSDRKNEGVGFVVGGAFQANLWQPDNSRLDDVDLYKLKVPLYMDLDAFREDFVFGLGVTPGIHSDFKEIDDDDFRVEGSISLTYISSPTLQYIAGILYDEEFGDPRAYPLFGALWQASDNWLLDMVFPKPRAQYSVSERFRLFAFGEPSGGAWNVGDDVDTKRDIEQKGYRLGAGLEVGLSKKSWIYLAGGAEFSRELQVAINDDKVFDDKVELEDQTFVRIGFRISR